MDREPATVGKRRGVSSQTRSQALGFSRVERVHALEFDRATPAARGRMRPESGFAAQPTGVRRASRPSPAAGGDSRVLLSSVGDCFMITVNGEGMDWREGMTIADILKARNYIFRMIAVFINGDLIKRGTYEKAVVPDGADVQVIHMISGG